MKTWTTAEGHEIQIVKMSDSHLINTIKLLKRSANELKGNVAANIAEASGDVFGGMDIIEMDDEEFLTIYVDQYNALIEELNNRELKLNL